MNFRCPGRLTLLAGILAFAPAEPGFPAPALPAIPARTFNVGDSGAGADGRTANPAAVSRAGGGALVVSAGGYFTGPVELRSALNLRLEAGAHLFFTPDCAAYRIADKTHRPLVGGKGCHDVEISGDSPMSHFVPFRCEDVTVDADGVSLRNVRIDPNPGAPLQIEDTVAHLFQ